MASEVVLVQLTKGGPHYSYFNHEETLVETDLVIVELPNRDNARITPYAIGIVVDTDPVKLARDRATKWIVCKVDTDKYEALKQMTPEVEDNAQDDFGALREIIKLRNKRGKL